MKLNITLVLLLTVLSGCGREISSDQARDREGLIYEVSTGRLYTGKIVDYYPEFDRIEIDQAGPSFRSKEGSKKSFEMSVVNGRREGVEISWSRSGDKSFEANWVNGLREGIQTNWNAVTVHRETGEITDVILESHFVSGQKEGLETAWIPYALREIYRVLKPAGSISFCAPIYLHGHEMFISGDFPRLRGLFDPPLWRSGTIESWREDYFPLEEYQAPGSDKATCEGSVTGYSNELLDAIYENRSVSLIAITAEKADH